MLKPRRIINKARFKVSLLKNRLFGYKIKPLEQIKSTCWFYSILHLIKHSPILKNNIAYSIMTHKHLMEDARKNTRNTSNRCSVLELYHKTLQTALSGNLKESELKNFIKKMARPIFLKEFPNRRMARLAKLNNNNNNENEKNILNVGSGTFNNILKVFRNLLVRLGLPQSTISTVPKPGYTLAGALISFEMTGRRRSIGNTAHAVAGILNSYGGRKIINSNSGRIYNINWNVSRNEFKKVLENKWSNINWSNSYNLNKNNSNYQKTNLKKIYVKKLY